MHSTNNSEEMDSTEPALASQHGSPTDRGKRAAQSSVLSPTKAPLYKKQHWDAPGETQQQDSSHESDRVEKSTDILEKKVADHSNTYHEVTEACHQHSEELSFLYAKAADLEDHYRWNNVKF